MSAIDIKHLVYYSNAWWAKISQPSSNIIFIFFQIHRRARALMKLAKQLVEGKTILSSKTLQNYIMPYATTTIFNEKMLKVSF